MNNRIANDLIRYAELVEDGALISPEEMNCASVMRLAAEYLVQPKQKQWVGLTDEETAELVHRYAFYGLVEATESKLKAKNERKEKNNGS